jgi:hypothetical protein
MHMHLHSQTHTEAIIRQHLMICNSSTMLPFAMNRDSEVYVDSYCVNAVS